MEKNAPLLEMRHISKSFSGVYANQDVSMVVEKGEIHALLGENGAGKTTLMNILYGLYQADAGEILWKGKPVHFSSPEDAIRTGIGMVQQHFSLVRAMSVLDNVILGLGSNHFFLDREKAAADIESIAERYGLPVDVNRKVSDMSVGEMQRTEILKALYRGCDVLVLDEPTAALTDQEAEGLFEIMNKLKQEGKSVIFISHKMREVLRVSDRITILRAGQTVETVNIGEVSGEELANRMIGRELKPSQYVKSDSSGEIVAALDHVSYHKSSKHNGLNDVSLKVHRGEIVGIAGVDGNGQSQLAMLLTGNIAPEEGAMDLKNSKVTRFDPNGFIQENVSHIPEDRNKAGLVGNMSVADNLVLKSTRDKRFSDGNGMHLKKKAIRSYALEMQEKYDIRCSSVEQESRNLSGGNQQKVILARELEASPDLLVAVHPTRGLDIGATRFIHDTVIMQRDMGCGVLLISADFDEILEVSDRILVMFEGQIMGEYSGKNPPIDEISLAMAGK